MVKCARSAEKAGLRPGFTLTGIDGDSVMNIMKDAPRRPPFTPSNNLFFKSQALLWALYGEPGSSVSLHYIDGAGQVGKAEIERSTRLNSVELYPDFPPVYLDQVSRELPGGIHYLKFNAFQPDIPQLIIDAIESSGSQAPTIIDLRGNNGGSAAATSELIARFTPHRLLAYTRQGRHLSEAVYINPADYVHSGKVVILVDELSISAAENFAGIMQHAGLAVVFGKQTPGQLLWGEGFPLGDNVIAVIPVAQIVFPSSRNLEGVGISPNKVVDLKQSDLLNGVDTQLQAAMDYLKPNRPD